MSHLSSEQRTEVKAQIDEAIENYLMEKSAAENKATWGFLKNIVNIDRFFAAPDNSTNTPITASVAAFPFAAPAASASTPAKKK